MASYGAGHGRENLDEPDERPEVELLIVGKRIISLSRLRRWPMGEAATDSPTDEVPW